MQYLLNGKTSIQTKQSPVIFVQQFSFLSEKIFQSVVQLSGNISEDFAKTAGLKSWIKTGFTHGFVEQSSYKCSTIQLKINNLL